MIQEQVHDGRHLNCPAVRRPPPPVVSAEGVAGRAARARLYQSDAAMNLVCWVHQLAV